MNRIFLQQFSRQYQINCGSLDFSAPTNGAFDLEIDPYSGEFDQMPRGLLGGGGMIAFGIDPDITREDYRQSVVSVIRASSQH